MKKLLIICISALILGLMAGPAFSQDSDNDSIPDIDDNCQETPNGPDNGTCAEIRFGIYKGTGVTCMDNSTCETGETCQKDQEDCNGNGIGDVCECYADINGDEKVALFDLIEIRIEFGRDDCSSNPCEADVNIDGKVTLPDLVIMKIEYGRGDCPTP